MIILDSNIWIAYFDRDDSTHKKAMKIFQKIEKSDVVITEYILLEVSTVLKQNKGHKIAKKFLQIIIDQEIFFLESSVFYKESLLLFYSLVDNKLSFVDISLLYLAKKYQIKTFDKDLEKIINRPLAKPSA